LAVRVKLRIRFQNKVLDTVALVNTGFETPFVAVLSFIKVYKAWHYCVF
jgi:hypothetical protein